MRCWLGGSDTACSNFCRRQDAAPRSEAEKGSLNTQTGGGPEAWSRFEAHWAGQRCGGRGGGTGAKGPLAGRVKSYTRRGDGTERLCRLWGCIAWEGDDGQVTGGPPGQPGLDKKRHGGARAAHASSDRIRALGRTECGVVPQESGRLALTRAKECYSD